MRRDVAERARARLLLLQAPVRAARPDRPPSPAGTCRDSDTAVRACPRRSAASPASPRAPAGSCGRSCGRRRPSAPRRASARLRARVFASGFSQNTTLPAFAAAIAISAWLSPGVLMSTMSMSARVTTSCQSVAASSQPSCSAAASHVLRVAPADHLHPRRERRGEEARDLPPGVAVRPAHEGVPDQCHIDVCHVEARMKTRQENDRPGDGESTPDVDNGEGRHGVGRGLGQPAGRCYFGGAGFFFAVAAGAAFSFLSK